MEYPTLGQLLNEDMLRILCMLLQHVSDVVTVEHTQHIRQVCDVLSTQDLSLNTSVGAYKMVIRIIGAQVGPFLLEYT